jgi:glucosyl-dolichyl phosphate glucuronosyltransferase
MDITVILCTHNRCDSLARTLDSLAHSELPPPVVWEVLVVDNNSSDRTRQVVEKFCQWHPGRFRYCFEPQQGKSFALNAGVWKAQGDVLTFVDDDVIVEPTWLQNLTAALHGNELAGSGGRILPERTFSPPRWLSVDGPYGCLPLAFFDRGLDAGPLAEPPYGTNMAYRKEMFEKYGGFRVDLGPRPGSEIRSEDTEFGRRLLAAGERLWYEPSAVVYHPASEHRVQKKYFLKWWFGLGRASVREWGRGPSVLGIPRPYLNILKLGTVVMAERTARWMVAMNPQKRFYYKCRVWLTKGQIREYVHLAHSSPRAGVPVSAALG